MQGGRESCKVGARGGGLSCKGARVMQRGWYFHKFLEGTRGKIGKLGERKDIHTGKSRVVSTPGPHSSILDSVAYSMRNKGTCGTKRTICAPMLAHVPTQHGGTWL